MEKGQVLLCNIAAYEENSYDSLGNFYLAAVLKKHGYDVSVFHKGAEEFVKLFDEHKDGIYAVGFTCYNDNQHLVSRLCKYVKKNSSVMVIVGGPQAISLEKAFFEESNCDFMIRGEGETALVALLEAVANKTDLRKVCGLVWVNQKNEVVVNKPSKVVENLDDIPFPDYSLSLHKNRRYGNTIITGRGCPFSCAYCFKGYEDHKVRLRSIRNVMEEINRNLDNNPRISFITICDDTFVIQEDRIRQFCNEMKALRKRREIVWYCEAHTHLLQDKKDTLKQMAESGCIRIQIGTESGDPEVLQQYNKHTTPEIIKEVVCDIVEAGIPMIATNFIIGGPNEATAWQKSASLAEDLLEIAPGVIDISTGYLRAYPDTRITLNPEAFGLKIIKPFYEASKDYPNVMPADMTEEEMIIIMNRFNSRIGKKINRLVLENKVPIERILRHVQFYKKYGIASIWYNAICSRADWEAYYKTIDSGAMEVRQIPEDQLSCMRPQRTVELWKEASFEDEGRATVCGLKLNPLAYDVLLMCSGKTVLADIANELFEKYKPHYQGKAAFEKELMKQIFYLGENHLIVIIWMELVRQCI